MAPRRLPRNVRTVVWIEAAVVLAIVVGVSCVVARLDVSW